MLEQENLNSGKLNAKEAIHVDCSYTLLRFSP